MRSVSEEEIHDFHRDGAVILKEILSDEWIDMLTAGLEYSELHPDGMSSGVNAPLRIDQFPASHSPDLKAFIENSPVAEIVGRVLNAPVRFYMDQMFYKPAGMITPSAWHQDTCYYNVDGHQLIRAWVCADPAPRNVSLEVVRGSHLWNVTYRPPVGLDPRSNPEAAAQLEKDFVDGKILIGRDAHEKWTYFDSFLDDSLPELPSIDAERESFDILGWDYEPGDVILFHGHILHSALGGVELAHPRRSHASLWAGPDVHYLRRRSQAIPDPLALYDHNPKDGQQLSEFPDVFPVAWAPAA
ncbi:MAG: phytanoyl-CoA dioxygenase family protein [Pseudomonadales bacterium]|nr:phytanoyl-CoA dioxygenase family protein [Pseudomonadales bacterium]